MACRLARSALRAVSFNWSAIDLMRSTDSPQRSPQIGRLISAGQPRDRWAGAAGEKRDGAGEHVPSPRVMCMSVQTFFFFFVFFFSVPPISFLVLPVVPCRPILLVPAMHDGD